MAYSSHSYSADTMHTTTTAGETMKTNEGGSVFTESEPVTRREGSSPRIAAVRQPVFRDNYAEVKSAAQAEADRYGFDYGVERDAYSYRFFMLPRRENRAGHELRCEVVSCSNYDRTQKGHGSK